MSTSATTKEKTAVSPDKGSQPDTPARAEQLSTAMGQLVDNIERVIVGKRDVVELLVIGMLSGGHVLIEDVPGTGKTMLARSLARSVNGNYKRIQFTPDLLPADVTGAMVFNMKTQTFEFRQGPVFTNILLADEINRGTPRTQSSLLECMEEGMVTADGQNYPLSSPFFVIATQNPIEHYGTYPLPEAQLDRFCMRLQVGYPSLKEESDIVHARLTGEPLEELQAVLSPEDVLRLRKQIRQIYVEEKIRNYAIRICAATREHHDIRLGASPRASLAIIRVAQGIAALRGRDYTIPQDIKTASLPVLGHRLIVGGHSGNGQIQADEVVKAVVNQTPVPVVSQ